MRSQARVFGPGHRTPAYGGRTSRSRRRGGWPPDAVTTDGVIVRTRRGSMIRVPRWLGVQAGQTTAKTLRPGATGSTRTGRIALAVSATTRARQRRIVPTIQTGGRFSAPRVVAGVHSAAPWQG